jgi:hypothetical protein
VLLELGCLAADRTAAEQWTVHWFGLNKATAAAASSSAVCLLRGLRNQQDSNIREWRKVYAVRRCATMWKTACASKSPTISRTANVLVQMGCLADSTAAEQWTEHWFGLNKDTAAVAAI